MIKLEYRVVWKRHEGRRKVRRFVARKNAERFMTLLGPEPWKAFGREPHEFDCCSGNECGCGGLTVKEQSDEKRKEMPVLEFARIEKREVGEWDT